MSGILAILYWQMRAQLVSSPMGPMGGLVTRKQWILAEKPVIVLHFCIQSQKIKPKGIQIRLSNSGKILPQTSTVVHYNRKFLPQTSTFIHYNRKFLHPLRGQTVSIVRLLRFKLLCRIPDLATLSGRPHTHNSGQLGSLIGLVERGRMKKVFCNKYYGAEIQLRNRKV